MSAEKTLLTIVVPVFNEEEGIGETHRRLLAFREKLAARTEVKLLYVNDGSRDSSLAILSDYAAKQPFVQVINFSRNFGHQMAITAGVDLAQGDFVAVIDADLQDPPELIEAMLEKAQEGYDVVYGKRRSRSGETIFKKFTAAAFYRTLRFMCDIEIPADTGDFRLMSRRAVEALKALRERHRFVRGMVPWVGFKQIGLEYDRHERFAGETKYPLRKMLAFATNAILSFSPKPITLAVRLGIITTILGVLGGAYMLYLKLFTEVPVPGITSILVTIVIFGGVQIFLIGVMGEYIARIFEEAKGRPLYIIEKTHNLGP